MSPAYIFKRIVLVGYTLLVVSLLVFGLTQLLPADAAVTLLGENATPAALAAGATPKYVMLHEFVAMLLVPLLIVASV